MAKTKYDFIVVGAGIVGLSLAQELTLQYPKSSILIIEKEQEIGLHASGRNSGVLHSGLYYPSASLKAKFCAQGARYWREYCHEHSIACRPLGKVVVPTRAEDDQHLEMLLGRAQKNQATAELIDTQQLKELEPDVHSASGRALYCPETSVIDGKAVLYQICAVLNQNNNVSFLFGDKVIQHDASQKSIMTAQGNQFSFGHLFNSAGLYSDKVAKLFGAGQKYTSLPFKGLYYQLKPESKIRCNGLVYPVPDLNMPFLGVHFTRTFDDKIYLGPTAVPALGREHYHGMQGIDYSDLGRYALQMMKFYWQNTQGFRQYCHSEAFRFIKRYFTKGAQQLVPDIEVSDLISCQKVGIRPQLVNLETQSLEMDFVIEHHHNTTHILNAISPAFTSAPAFVKYVVKDV